MAPHQEEHRKLRPNDGPQPWMTPFEKLVCDPTNSGNGFTKKALRRHGVPWPPPKGWRSAKKAEIFARAPKANAPRRRHTALTSYEVDRKKYDLAGFADTASLQVKPGPSGTIVIEQIGFFAASAQPNDRCHASAYVVVKRSAVADLNKRVRSAHLQVVATVDTHKDWLDEPLISDGTVVDSALALPA